MRLLRFMSVNEAFQLIQGGDVHNDKNHHAAGNMSTCIGSCFALLPSKNEEDEIFLKAQYLAGITTMDVCLVATIKLPARKGFKAGFGWYKQGKLKEFSTVKYRLEYFEDWHMYAPNDRYVMMPTLSPNWFNPVLLTQRQDW